MTDTELADHHNMTVAAILGPVPAVDAVGYAELRRQLEQAEVDRELLHRDV